MSEHQHLIAVRLSNGEVLYEGFEIGCAGCGEHFESPRDHELAKLAVEMRVQFKPCAITQDAGWMGTGFLPRAFCHTHRQDNCQIGPLLARYDAITSDTKNGEGQ